MGRIKAELSAIKVICSWDIGGGNSRGPHSVAAIAGDRTMVQEEGREGNGQLFN